MPDLLLSWSGNKASGFVGARGEASTKPLIAIRIAITQKPDYAHHPCLLRVVGSQRSAAVVKAVGAEEEEAGELQLP